MKQDNTSLINTHFDLPEPEVIDELLSHGSSYSKAIEQDTYTKYHNFKAVPMNKNKKKEKNDKEITRESFRWHTKDKASSIDEMDGDFLLAAMTHCLKLQNEHFVKHEKARKKLDYHNNRMEYFYKNFQIMEDEFIDRYNMDVPEDIDGIKAMRTLIDRGTLKIKNFTNE